MNTLVQVEYPRPHVALITLNDPDHLNAFSTAMMEALTAAVAEADRNPDIHAAVLTGAGKGFVAGADIKYMQTLTPDQAIAYSHNTTAIYDLIEHSRTIFIAAVNGYALGAGCELSLACDLRIASEYAKFGLPETGLGIIPGGHGTQKLPRLLGEAKAKELIFLGTTVRAPEALSLGLVNQVVSADALVETALELAERIGSGASTAIGYAKEAVRMSSVLDQKSGYVYEEKLFGLCFATAEQKEGMAAFVEHRKPDFTK